FAYQIILGQCVPLGSFAEDDRPQGNAFEQARVVGGGERPGSSNGTETRNKDRYAARSSNSSGSRSGRSCPCRTDSFRANSYRPSTLTCPSSNGESRSTSAGLTTTAEARSCARAASR